MTRLLVVGRQGQLASALQREATAQRWSHVCLGRPDLDLTQPDTIARAFDRHRPEIVINAAAYTAVDRAESEADTAFALNRDGPAVLARLCAAAGTPLIHVSTDQVFDGSLPRAYREDDAVNPISVYGRSKLEGEEQVLSLCPAALVVRVSWVFGPDGDNFVTKVLSWAKARANLTIVNDQRGRPTYSPDLAIELARLGALMGEGGAGAPSGVLHLAGADVVTRETQARMVLEASRRRGGPFAAVTGVATADFPTPARRGLNAELDVSLAHERHGIMLGHFARDLDRTLDRLIGPARPQPTRKLDS